jgi:HAD superfamily hydrolase (TIGR01509 family)
MIGSFWVRLAFMAGHGAADRDRQERFVAAIFDMDGLLIDSEPSWRQVEMAIFDRLGVSLTEELCLETKGMVVDEVTRHWYGLYPWTGPTPEVVAEEIVDAMVALLSGTVMVKPGALHALRFCHDRGLAMAIASSSPLRLIEGVVDGLGLADWFGVLHSAQDEVVGKPDPAVFLTTARRLGVTPSACVVFEDSPAGVRAAIAAGMACVAVPETDVALTHDDRRSLASADLILHSLEDLDDDLWTRLA